MKVVIVLILVMSLFITNVSSACGVAYCQTCTSSPDTCQTCSNGYGLNTTDSKSCFQCTDTNCV